MPSLLDSEIPTGELLTVNADDPVHYDVLSYMYGPGEPSFIRRDGKAIRVAKDLGEALHLVRHRLESRLLWSDALCIDENSRLDRSLQIAVVPHIISMSKGVIFYVNWESSDIRMALQLISELGTARRKVFGDSPSSSLAPTASRSSIRSYRDRLPMPTSPGWKAVNELLQERAFQRLSSMFCLETSMAL
jgi:hypothetical protein